MFELMLRLRYLKFVMSLTAPPSLIIKPSQPSASRSSVRMIGCAVCGIPFRAWYEVMADRAAPSRMPATNAGRKLWRKSYRVTHFLDQSRISRCVHGRFSAKSPIKKRESNSPYSVRYHCIVPKPLAHVRWSLAVLCTRSRQAALTGINRESIGSQLGVNWD
eukprot:SAG31_NODE_713_length_12651_cov_180.009481_4_plen_162_part_00